MNKNENSVLLSQVASYYSDKLSKYGLTPLGVDWNSEESQLLRFEQLCKIITDETASFSINGLGCSYGSLLDFLSSRYTFSPHLGVDVSQAMINASILRFINNSQARFIVDSKPDTVADYGIASGIFNIRLGRTDSEWLAYLQTTLDDLDFTCLKGFVFNCLTSYSDAEKKREYLNYANPCQLCDLCKNRYSQQVSILDDYGLYEFTILARKSK